MQMVVIIRWFTFIIRWITYGMSLRVISLLHSWMERAFCLLLIKLFDWAQIRRHAFN